MLYLDGISYFKRLNSREVELRSLTANGLVRTLLNWALNSDFYRTTALWARLVTQKLLVYNIGTALLNCNLWSIVRCFNDCKSEIDGIFRLTQYNNSKIATLNCNFEIIGRSCTQNWRLRTAENFQQHGTIYGEWSYNNHRMRLSWRVSVRKGIQRLFTALYYG